MKNILFLLLSVLTLNAGNVTLMWDQNTETNIDHYTVYRSVNGGGYLATPVGFPTNIWTFTDVAPGNTYNFYVTATTSTLLESGPSTNLVYTPPGVSPPVDVLSVRPTSFSFGNWLNVIVTYSPVNLALYQASAVTITAVSGSSTQTWAATTSPFVISSLPVKTYTFTATVVNASGTSSPGSPRVLDGTPPANVRNVKIQVGP